MNGNSSQEPVASAISPAVLELVESVIQVTAKPDNGEGGPWWIGFDLNHLPHGANGFWDPSCPDEAVARTCAAECRLGLARLIQDVIDRETAQARNKIVCAGCGQNVVDRDDPDFADKMTEHIVKCERHPLSQMMADASQSLGSQQIAAERRRQIEVEGFDEKHDANHTPAGALVAAAIVYASGPGIERQEMYDRFWPWGSEWYKPKDTIRDLVRAGALIAAEIDRLQALEQSAAQPATGSEPSGEPVGA